MENDYFTKREGNSHCVSSSIGLENPDTGKIYTDLTGRFPVTNNRVIQYMLILYAYDTNAILVEPIKNEVMHTCCTHMMSYMTY